MDLHVLGYPEHDLTISEKCLSVYVWKNLVASLTPELMQKISWNFIFNVIPGYNDVYQLLVKVAQQVVL